MKTGSTFNSYVSYRNSLNDLYVNFDKGMLYIKGVVDRTNGYANLSFVVESLQLPPGHLNYDCVNESEESMRYLGLNNAATVCFGPTRLRSLTEEEISQMQKFKGNQDGKWL